MKATHLSRKGFTLIELMLVVTIVGILASVALLSYRHFTKKAQSVEAEVAIAEIHRLQQLHQAQSGSFAGDLRAIGFNPIPPLKFYSVEMRFLGGTDGIAYQAYAYAKEQVDGSTSLVLTQYQDGHMTVDKSLVSAPAASSGAGGSGAGSLPGTGSSAGSQSGDGGGAGGDSSAGSTSSSSSSGGGQRTVTHMNQSVGMSSQ
ncbi:type IV pilin protein [Nitrospira lenta]|uniref:Prepilin-type N-terminal cleavage/methylation domain-containing protein n=1 Tax=Nitrospira lenta TaxID=1436998 RepID=A0A330L8L8_9BACT|nr:prepilin-type N-terminal cleavage/methylation domain-containing protein [Nitrospira lenta]SPP63276.1 hypothetical protein NITLEN_10362 [Nitrospira lenta]